MSDALPRIEDLTADSDLSAFLRAGVPQALKTAALRRAWSLDPAIRDYVGPSEYAYDFNDPATIPGFGSGPVHGTGSAAEFARKIVQHSGTDEATAQRAIESVRPELKSVRHTPKIAAPPPAAHPSVTSGAAPENQASPETIGETAREPAGIPEGEPSPRHGGAMPR